MSESEESPKRLRVISGDVIRGEGVRAVLNMAAQDHREFKSVMVIAVIPTDDPDFDDCRVYSTNLNFLEKRGLLDQAKDSLT